jgi:hypothetical protein
MTMTICAVARPIVGFKPAVWTIVDGRRGSSFGLSARGGEKTALVGFTQRTDAMFVARALEQFRLKNGRWPYSHPNGERDTLLQLDPPNINVRTLAALDLRVWSTVGSLHAECEATYLDLCLCTQVKRGATLEFVGKYIVVDPEADAFCASKEFMLCKDD